MSGTDQNTLSNNQPSVFSFEEFDADPEQQGEYDDLSNLTPEELQELQELSNSLIPADAPPNPPQTNNNPNIFEPPFNHQASTADFLEHNQPIMHNTNAPSLAPPNPPAPIQPQMQPNYFDPYPQSLAPGYGMPPQLASNQAKQSLQQPFARNYVYRNAILNEIPSSDRALQIIDQFIFPIPGVIQSALEREIPRQNDEETARIVRQAVEDKPRLMEVKPYPRKAEIKPLKGSKNKRSANIRSINPAEWYETIPEKPKSWGSINRETGQKTFRYSSEGELTPGVTYTVPQILEYLGEHPLHSRFGPQGDIDTHRSTLKLWVQKAPADSAHRYPTPVSSKCRFEDCPKDNNTITKGESRVCFDEINPDNYSFNPNPFHNAGYVHLYCLEHFLDFPDICKKLNVLPDSRQLAEGKNPMAINKDESSQAKIVKEFVKKSKPWSEFDASKIRPANYYEHTLAYKIASEHLKSQSSGVQNIRRKRDGNSLDVHKGNLHTYAENVKIIKAAKARVREATKTSPPPQKRKRLISVLSDVDEDEEDILDDNILELEARPMKKTKRS